MIIPTQDSCIICTKINGTLHACANWITIYGQWLQSYRMLNSWCLGKNPNNCPTDEQAPQHPLQDQDSSIGEMPEALTSQGGALS